MAVVNSEIRFAPQLTTWFAANPTKVLQDGELVYCKDGANIGKYVIGDNSTQLSSLTFYGGVSSSGLTIGTTTITSGTNTRILYNNSGVVGEYTLTGSGTVVAMQTSPVLITPLLGTPTSGDLQNCTGVNDNPFNMIRIVGRYYGWFGASGASTSGGFGQNARRAVPYFIPYNHTITAIRCHCSSGGVGAKVRMGIYSDNGSFAPGNLLVDAGEVDCSSSGLKELSINQALTRSMRLVWLTYNLTGNPSMTFFNATSIQTMGSDSGSITGNLGTARSAADTYGGGYVLPTPFGSVAAYESSASNTIAIEVKVGSIP